MGSRHKRSLTLPARYVPTCASDLVDGHSGCTLLGEVCCDQDGLYVFQDDISKQVFWYEGGPDWTLEKNKEQHYWGLWRVLHCTLERFETFVRGYAPHIPLWDEEQRENLIAAVREAMKSAPSDEWSDAYEKWGVSKDDKPPSDPTRAPYWKPVPKPECPWEVEACQP